MAGAWILGLTLTVIWAADVELARDEFAGEYPDVLIFEGEIEPGDFRKILLKLHRNFNRYKEVRTIYLNSQGGSLKESVFIGKLVKALRLKTAIRSPEDKCNSACALIWMAGVERTWNIHEFEDELPKIGLHRPYHHLRTKDAYEKYTDEDFELVHKMGTEMHNWFLSQNDVPKYLIEKSLNTPSIDIYYLSKEDFFKLGPVQDFWEEYIIQKCNFSTTLEICATFNRCGNLSGGFKNLSKTGLSKLLVINKCHEDLKSIAIEKLADVTFVQKLLSEYHRGGYQ
jgi:hypothetical protein